MAAFNIMLKPAGSLCNLDCHYCYYLDKAGLYGGREPRMSLEMLETVVREYIAANDVPEVCFNWHGGEPLVLGIDFYRKAVEFQKKYAGGKVVHNTLQTNGTLLTREWAQFFRENGFLLGVSLDGPQDIHDKYRKDKGGKPTFQQVLRGINLLQSQGVPFNILSTVNHASEGRGREVYQFLKSVGGQYLQFMPVLEHVKGDKQRPYIVAPGTEGARIAPWSVEPRAFGRFLCDIFDSWVLSDVGRTFVNLFDATLAAWCGVPAGMCIYGKYCGGNFVIEHNGDLYSCDHFVYENYLLGNIRDKSIREMMASPQQEAFALAKWTGVPQECRQCRWFFACHGECPKHRFNRTGKGAPGLNALCEGYQLYYRHVAPYMDYMRDLLSREQPAALVMPWARSLSGRGI